MNNAIKNNPVAPLLHPESKSNKILSYKFWTIIITTIGSKIVFEILDGIFLIEFLFIYFYL